MIAPTTAKKLPAYLQAAFFDIYRVPMIFSISPYSCIPLMRFFFIDIYINPPK